jgi:hypothetical protein
MKARISEIMQGSGTAVLLGDDVLDFKRGGVGGIG